MTPAERDDMLFELRELLPMVRDNARGAKASADHTSLDDYATGFEPARMRTARMNIAQSFRTLADNYDAYATAIVTTIAELEGER